MYLEQFQPINIDLGNTQSRNCTIRGVAHIFKNLRGRNCYKTKQKSVEKKKLKMTITSVHLFDYLLNLKAKDAVLRLPTNIKAALE